MQHKKWVAELLAQVPPNRKKAQFNAVRPFIDHQIALGVAHADIVAALKESGFNISLNTFSVYLYRARKKSQELVSIRSSPMTVSPAPNRAPGNTAQMAPVLGADVWTSIAKGDGAMLDPLNKQKVDFQAVRKAAQQLGISTQDSAFSKNQ